MRRLLRAAFRLALTVLLVAATLLVAYAVQSRSVVLKPWHRVVPAAELHEADLPATARLDEVLRREEVVLREVRQRVVAHVPPTDREAWNRYWAESPLNPGNLPQDFNRSFELAPSEVRGGVLLVHGLTDSPYSMRSLAEQYRDLGYHALALRMPGHGTVPAGLTDTGWRDWAAAVRVGARHVREKAGPGKPFHLVGYSNGGALAVDYALDVLDGAALPRPDRLLLVSPMIGVAPVARLARTLSLLGFLPPFAASRWLDVTPEFNPFKYCSFPARAATESHALTARLDERLARAAQAGTIGKLPPALTFLSVVDATVRTPDTVRRLYDRLAANGSELVVFDLNRTSDLRPFLRAADQGLLAELLPDRPRPYAVSVVTNAGPATRDVVERALPAGTDQPRIRPLGLAWPEGVFSLSHVALPFPPDDPLYGGRAAQARPGAVNLGSLDPRGERTVLTVPVDVLMRLTWNPFYPYLEERVRGWARLPDPPPAR